MLLRPVRHISYEPQYPYPSPISPTLASLPTNWAGDLVCALDLQKYKEQLRKVLNKLSSDVYILFNKPGFSDRGFPLSQNE